MTSKEKVIGSYTVVVGDEATERNFRVKGKFPTSMSANDIVDSLQEKLAQRLRAEGIYDYDLVEANFEAFV